MDMLNGICGKVAPGLCRLSIQGCIAVKTGAGYRTYDAAHKRLMNCDGFALDIGDDAFFVLPVNHVKPEDIILAGGSPKCVVSSDGSTITAIDFESGRVETFLPERHQFMGNTYFYGKIVSLFGRNGIRGRKGAGRMMKYMMLRSMMQGGGNASGASGGLSGMLPLLMLGGKMDGMDELFDDFTEEDPDDEMAEETKEEED